MLELIGAVIEKLGELLLERKLDKKTYSSGCVALFELYLTLGSVVGWSENICG
jgi:hypothetical protein